MENKESYPNYKLFLESVNYDSIEIEKYFKVMLDNLKNEAFLLLKDRDIEIQNAYNEYNNSLIKHTSIKYDILNKYLDEYKELNEKYNLDIEKLESEYIIKKNEVLDSLETKRDVLRKIKNDLMLEFFENKKTYQKRINDVNKKIGEEYSAHINTIFLAKEKVLKNNHFILTLDKHIDDIKKYLSFFKELKNNLVVNPSFLMDNSFDTLINSINEKTSLVDENKNYINETFKTLVSFKSIAAYEDNIIKEIDKRIKLIDDDFYNINNKVQIKLKNLDSSISIVESEYKSTSLDKSKSDLKKLQKRRDILLSSLNSKKESIALSVSIEKDLLAKEKETIIKIKDDIISSINENYETFFASANENYNMLISTFDILNNIYKSLKEKALDIKNNFSIIKEILTYYKEKLTNLEIDKKIVSLEKYLLYLQKIKVENQDFDCLAFEILTNEELLEIKLLDLKKEYLTIDDETKIKEIKYDCEIKEIERLKNINLSIIQSSNELELIKNDLLIDKKIKKNELNNAIKLLDLRKQIDILSSDYMIAYKRLENVSKLSSIKNTYDLKSLNITSTYNLEKIIELSLLDAINKKNNFESLITKYDKDIISLNDENSQRIRYMKNILEIERNKFDERRKKLITITSDLESLIYPYLKDEKIKSSNIIKKITKLYEEDISLLIVNNEKDKQNYLPYQKAIKEYSKKYNNIINNIFNYQQKGLNGIFKDKSCILNSFQNTYSNMYKDANDLLKIYEYHNILTIQKNKKKYDKLSFYILKMTKEERKDNINKEIIFYLNQELKEILSSIIKDLSIYKLKFKPISKQRLKYKTNKISKEKKNLIAFMAIEHSFNIDSYLNDVDKIRNLKIIENKKLEKEISDYKKSYLLTIESIKKDYEIKNNKLTAIRNNAIFEYERIGDSINEKINTSVAKIDNAKLSKKLSIESSNVETSQVIKNTISNLSNKIKNNNQNYIAKKESVKKANESFKELMIKEAKDYFKKIDALRNDTINYLENEKQLKIKNKEAFLHKINEESLYVKENFKKRCDDIIALFENKKADNSIILGKEYNNLIEESTDIFNSTLLDTNDFCNANKKIVNNLLNKIEDLENELINEGEKAIVNMNNIISDTLSSLEEN